MNNSQLIELIGTLPPVQYEALRKFMASPYFNEGAGAGLRLQLTELILAAATDQQAESLSKEKVYAAIFPGDAPVKGKLDKLMTETLRLVRRFVVLQETEWLNHPIHEQIALARYYRQKGLEQRFKLACESLQEQLDAVPVRDKQYFYQLYALERERFEYLHTRNDRKGDLNLRPSIQAFDHYFILNRLELVANLITQGQFTTLDISTELDSLRDILNWMRRDEFRDTLMIRLYDFVIRLLLQHEPIDLEELLAFRNLINAHSRELPVEMVRNFLAISRNFCIRRYNAGEGAYRRPIFDAFKADLEAGWLYENDALLPQTIQSISVCAIRNRELDWLYGFLQEHRYRIIHSDEPAQVYRYNMAHYFFEKKQYDEALDMLDNSYLDFYYQLGAKKLEIKCYYELNSDLLEFKLEAFKVFVFRQGNKLLNPLIRDLNNAFADMLRQIIHPASLHNPPRIRKLIDKIHQLKSIAEKDWLLEKLEAML